MKLTAPKAEYIPPALLDLLRADRCPHALLLTGSDDALRIKAAYATAAALVCEDSRRAPCGRCTACRKAKAFVHPDIAVFEGSEKLRTIGVHVIRRQIRETLYIAPNEAKRKVYVLLDADGMTGDAQNAFLKTLEEPPPFVAFVLAAGGREKLLPTVLSRCTQFPCGEKEQKEGNERAIAAALATALASRSETALLLAAAPLQKNRQLVKKTAVYLLSILRDAAVCDTGAPSLTGLELEANRLGMRYDFNALNQFCDILHGICAYADTNANENLLLTALTARLGSAMNVLTAGKEVAPWQK